jgi:hypothetical protein
LTEVRFEVLSVLVDRDLGGVGLDLGLVVGFEVDVGLVKTEVGVRDWGEARDAFVKQDCCEAMNTAETGSTSSMMGVSGVS